MALKRDSNRAVGRTIKGERTAKRIFEAAAECIADLGIERTSITEIAKRAKTSRALIARYLPKKADLLLEVIRHISFEGTPGMEDLPASAPAIKKILHSIERNFLFFSHNPHYYSCFVLLYYFSGVRDDLRKLNNDIYRHFIDRTALYLSDFSKEKRRRWNHEDIQALSESIYSELEGALLSYFSMIESRHRAKFLKRHLRAIQRKLLNY